MEVENEVGNELGVIKSFSEFSGWSLQAVANLFILILIFVFDPLAITLVIATNQAFKDLKPVKNMYGEIKVEKEPIKPKYNPLKEHPEDIYIPKPKKKTPLHTFQIPQFLPDISHLSIDEKIKYVQNQIGVISSSSLSSWRKEKDIKELKDYLEKLKSLNKDNQKTY